MDGLGEYLREARNRKGVDVREAARKTRINAVFIQALEDENFSKLPGPVFIRGFLRSYGNYLGLDQDDLMDRYQAQFIGKPQGASAPLLIEQLPFQKKKTVLWDRRGARLLAAVGIAVLLLITVGLGIYGMVRFAKGSRSEHPILPRATNNMQSSPVSSLPVVTSDTVRSTSSIARKDRLYLETVALENTWLHVTSDAGETTKTYLKKDERLIWNAETRFIVRFARKGFIKMFMNGGELPTEIPGGDPTRGLFVTAAGVENTTQQNTSR